MRKVLNGRPTSQRPLNRPRFRWKVNVLEMRVGCEFLLAGYSPASIESDKVSVTLDQKAIASRAIKRN